MEKEKKKKRVYIPYYLSLFTRMCLTVCVVLISCFCIFPKFSSRGLRIRAVVVYMLLLKSCGFPFILNPVFFLFLFRFERAGNRIVIRCAGRLDLRPGPARRSRYDELGELLQLPTTHTHTHST